MRPFGYDTAGADVETFQNALLTLGYELPKWGADGVCAVTRRVASVWLPGPVALFGTYSLSSGEFAELLDLVEAQGTRASAGWKWGLGSR